VPHNPRPAPIGSVTYRRDWATLTGTFGTVVFVVGPGPADAGPWNYEVAVSLVTVVANVFTTFASPLATIDAKSAAES
jgi:hypothetical protein